MIITTNEERVLPDAFLRRCLVLHLRLPQQREPLVDHLMARAAAHFPKAKEPILRRAAELLVEDREKAQREHWLPLPGQAEYLDLVRAVVALSSGAEGKRLTPEEILDRVESVLAEHFPYEAEDVDELSDELSFEQSRNRALPWLIAAGVVLTAALLYGVWRLFFSGWS